MSRVLRPAALVLTAALLSSCGGVPPAVIGAAVEAGVEATRGPRVPTRPPPLRAASRAVPPTTADEAPGNPLPGTWSARDECRDRVYVFTQEGHYFEMVADRTRSVGAEVWGVVKGRYDVSSASGSSFTTAMETNGDMHGLDLVVDSTSADALSGRYVTAGMAGDPDVVVPFQYVRCSTEGAWPY